MPANVAAVQEIQHRFESIMRIYGGTCTQFSQHIWMFWHAHSVRIPGHPPQPDLKRLCELLGGKWLIFRSQGGTGFVAHLMTEPARAELERDARINMASPDDDYSEQFQFTEQMLAQARLYRVEHPPPLERKANEGYEFLLPNINRLRASAGRYCMLTFGGTSRKTNAYGTRSLKGHGIAVDCVNFMLFDPEGGFASFTSMNSLVDAADRWLQECNAITMELNMCAFRSFATG
jgi:hypothetical protein